MGSIIRGPLSLGNYHIAGLGRRSLFDHCKVLLGNNSEEAEKLYRHVVEGRSLVLSDVCFDCSETLHGLHRASPECFKCGIFL